MPEPISASTRSVPLSEDPSLDEAGQVCRADVPSPATAAVPPAPPPAVTKLIKAVAPKAAALPPTNNNAQRTAAIAPTPFYLAGGVTSSGDAVFAGFSLLKGSDRKSGAEVDILGASAQVGKQTELQAGMAHAAVMGKYGSFSLDVLSMRQSSGPHNDDGSVGKNYTHATTFVAVEATLGGGPNNISIGGSLGSGYSASSGKRDVDHDGKAEYCFKISLAGLTLGACLEKP